MRNELKVFNNKEFGQIRTLIVNGKEYFCASDIAKALGYAIPSKAVNTHCKGVSKMEVPTNGGVQEMLFIPEGDIYRLIIKSKLPSAERFEKWVFEEVLPEIRKAGVFSVRPDSYMIEDPIERALAWAEEQRQARLKLEAVKEQVKLTRLQVTKLSKLLGAKLSERYGKRVSAYNSHYIAARAQTCAEFGANTWSEIKQDDFKDVIAYIETEI